MKNFILILIFLLLPCSLLAATYNGSVTRVTYDLYVLSPQDKYIRTDGCSETDPDDATLETDEYSAQLTFATSGTICAVEEVFDPFPLSAPLNYVRVNVSYDLQNWYALNSYDPSTLDINVVDNGRRLKTSSCSETPFQEFAYLTTNISGIGTLDFGGDVYCNVAGIYDRSFEAVDIWTVQNVDTEGNLDWLDTEHAPVAHGSYLRINNQYFYVYASDTDSPIGGSGYTYATLLACNQLTGEPGPGPYDEGGPQWADLTGLAGEDIEAFASWQDISDLTVNLDLQQGWNLISLPLNNVWYISQLPDVDLQNGRTGIPVPDLSEVFDSIAGQYDLVRSFDEEGEKSYDPALSENTLTYFSGGHGYWIKMNSPGTLTLTGRAPYSSDTLQLHNGWNLISHWGGDEKQVALSAGTSTYVADISISDELSSIIDSIELVRGFDADGAKTFDPDIPDNLNTLHSFEAGKGYWIKLNQDQLIDFAP